MVRYRSQKKDNNKDSTRSLVSEVLDLYIYSLNKKSLITFVRLYIN